MSGTTITKEIIEFDKEIQSISDHKPHVSASKITNLIKIALKNPKVSLFYMILYEFLIVKL